MKSQTESLEHASVRQYCKAVRVPVIGANFLSLAEQAVKDAGWEPTDEESRERTGVNRNVGRIVPKRNSLVTSSTPASAEKIPARLPKLSVVRWSSVVDRPLILLSSPVSSANSRISAIIPSTKPSVVRVERTFKSSALTCAITASTRGGRPRSGSPR